MNLNSFFNKKRIIILTSTIILTLIYYFSSLYYIRLSPTRKNIVFFYLIFGELFNYNIWLDFWQYIYQFLMSFILFFIFPVLIIKYYFRESIKDYGICIGNIKFNLLWTIIGIIISPIFLFISNDPELLNEYPLTKLALLNIQIFIVFNLCYILYYIGYEFIFRAYLQFGLKKDSNNKYSTVIILTIQTIITTLFHIGKPLSEIIASAAVGPLFGYLTLKGKSFIWPVLIFHTLIGIFTNCAPIFHFSF